MRRVLATPAGALGAGIVGLVAVAALFAPWIAPYDPDALAVLDRFAGLSGAHLLGTDQLGRDLFSRLLHGATVAMGVFGFARADSLRLLQNVGALCIAVVQPAASSASILP